MAAKLLLLILLGWTLAPSAPAQENIFHLSNKERPQRVIVTVTDDPPSPPDPAVTLPQMLGLLDGVVADLKGADLGKFLATPMPRTKLVDARGNLRRVGVAHLFGRDSVKRVELLYGNEGVFVAQELDDPADPGDSRKIAQLDPGRFWDILAPWPRYRGKIEPDPSIEEAAADPKPGAQVELPRPYLQAPFHLDQETLGERFLRGRKSTVPPVTRVLEQESMTVRLPRGYDPRRPAGVLIWISASREGAVPPVFNAPLDELGLIAIGIQNVGNDREVADRYQLALDAAWTAAARFHIDPRRVYLSGISGGGHIVSMLQACFPDYFSGAVPIVGLKAYFNVPVGNGRFVRAGYERPEPKLWALTRQRRVGPITGDTDGNGVVIREAASRMAADGIPIRVFDYKGLGHQMPSAIQLGEALRWVDEPYRTARAREEAAARNALDTYIRKFGKNPSDAARHRADLFRVITVGAWTDAAWEAVELLRAGAPKPDQSDHVDDDGGADGEPPP